MAFEVLAFGVEPGFLPYPLKLARYPALAEEVIRFVNARLQRDTRPVKLLDVGVGSGNSRRYIESQLDSNRIQYHGVDRFPRGRSSVYKHESWTLHEACLEKGLPFLGADGFDIVICEQVLEHLQNPALAAAELARVLKPGGVAIVGVPVFLPGVHLLRKYVVPVLDRCLPPKKTRGHVQAFCLPTFLNLLRRAGPLEVTSVRGFRVISGGLLRPLECFRWWWRLNRLIGSKIPSLCIEVQVVATKAGSVAESPRQDFRRPHPDRRAA